MVKIGSTHMLGKHPVTLPEDKALPDAAPSARDYTNMKFSIERKPEPDDWEATDKFPEWCEYHGPAGHTAADCKRAAEKKANVAKQLADERKARKARSVAAKIGQNLLAQSRALNYIRRETKRQIKEKKEKKEKKAAEKAS